MGSQLLEQLVKTEVISQWMTMVKIWVDATEGESGYIDSWGLISHGKVEDMVDDYEFIIVGALLNDLDDVADLFIGLLGLTELG